MSRIAPFSLLALPLLTIGFGTPAPAQTSGPPCVESRSEVRPALPGYNHIVVLTNRCDPTYTCTITTDVSTESVVADVPGKSEVSVTTFRGSPAPAFHHRTECEKKK